MRADRTLTTWCIAASLLLHLVWAIGIPRTPRRNDPPTQLIELTIATSEAPQPPAANSAAPAANRRPPREKRKPLPLTAARPQQPEHAQQGGTIVPSTGTLPAPGSVAPSPLDLTPHTAASTLASEAALPEHGRLCSPRGRTPAERCEDDLPESRAAETQDVLNRSLQAAAKLKQYLVRRDPPQLKRKSDGGYSFTGLVFEARIEPDGHVKFDDAPVVRPSVIPIIGTFDLTDAVEKYALHKELYSAEKRWFLDQTAALRERLGDAAHAAERARTSGALEQALERILASAQSPDQKRKAVFELWEECGDDPDSAAIRKWVEAFVRRRMPQDSPFGFIPSELERLNRSRPARFGFDPYRNGRS